MWLRNQLNTSGLSRQAFPVGFKISVLWFVSYAPLSWKMLKFQRLKYQHFGSSWSQNAQNGPQRSPRPKMKPKWLPNRYVLDSWSFFAICFRTYVFQCSFAFPELWKHQFLILFGTKFDNFWVVFGILGHVCPKRSQDTLIIAAGWPTWAYLDPTWIQVGSKLAQGGPMLAPS